MATSSPRSLAASVVGWVIVVLLLWIVGGAILGTLWWLVRGLLIFFVIGALIWLYFRLKAPE
ncbi:hypothetical protein [Ilumatobacter sp.]|uniref:hypothetical protein n=1 Tax=Ilumatobacter sp. TaxID=1967498 RepID=UPI003C5480E9